MAEAPVGRLGAEVRKNRRSMLGWALLGLAAYALQLWYFPQNLTPWKSMPGVFGSAEDGQRTGAVGRARQAVAVVRPGRAAAGGAGLGGALSLPALLMLLGTGQARLDYFHGDLFVAAGAGAPPQ